MISLFPNIISRKFLMNIMFDVGTVNKKFAFVYLSKPITTNVAVLLKMSKLGF